MVGKISEINVSPIVNIDSSSYDGDLLKWIQKKNKNIKAEENILPVALLTPNMQVQLLNVSVPGGGLQQAAKQSGSLSYAQSIYISHSEKGESLTRRVVSAVTELPTIAKPSENNSGEIKSIVSKIGNQLGKGESLTRRVVSTGSELPVIAKPSESNSAEIKASASSGYSTAGIQQTATLQHILAKSTVNVTNVNLPALPSSGAESEYQPPKQHKKEEGIEVRATFQGLKLPEVMVLPSRDITPQNRNTPAQLPSLTPNPEVTAIKPGSESPALEVNYPFQRWSGDHSVKVLVSTDSRREGAVTLLPSDSRAADVLARNMGQLTSLTPDFLMPEREHDEQQQRRQQQQDEEQE